MTRLITIEYDEYLDLKRLKAQTKIDIYERMVKHLSELLKHIDENLKDEIKDFIKCYENAINLEKEEIRMEYR